MILAVVELKHKRYKHLMYKMSVININAGVYKSSNYFVCKYILFQLREIRKKSANGKRAIKLSDLELIFF